jgi:hypothetical protein
MRVATVTVAFTNPAVTPVDEKLSALALSDLTGNLDRLRLCVGARGYARAARWPDRPLAVVRNYVLVWHILTSFRLVYDC